MLLFALASCDYRLWWFGDVTFLFVLIDDFSSPFLLSWLTSLIAYCFHITEEDFSYRI